MAGSRILICAALAASVFAAYQEVSGFPFLPYDDNIYVTENHRVAAGFSREGVEWALTEVRGGNWHPLTWMSHMLDCQLFGLDPAWPHRINVGFHALNACLLFLFLSLSTGSIWRSAFAAGLFALHPLRVESVAWIAERKDVLSACFALLTMLAWSRWSFHRSRLAYGSALVLFALGLASKPMLVTLPFALLLLDLWPLERLRPPWRWDRTARGLLLEKAPFFALSGVSIAITLSAQSSGIIEELGFGLRVSGALAAYRSYLAATFWPAGLAPLYPRPLEWSPLLDPATVVGLAAITVLAFRQLERRPYLLSGWLWFLGVLVPTLGLVAVGAQGWADRYTYLPSMGLAWALVWLAGDAVLNLASPRAKGLGKWAATAVGVALLVACGVGTHAQTRYWGSHRGLFERALAVTHGNYFAHTEVGIALRSEGRMAPAIEHLERAVAIEPTYAYAQGNLGLTLLLMNDPERAIPHLERAAELDPSQRHLHRFRGMALEATGRPEEAAEAYRAQLRLDPYDREAGLLLARLLVADPEPSRRSPDEARTLLRSACMGERCREASLQPLIAEILRGIRESEGDGTGRGARRSRE